jgi:mono/diheme cytochrome c family protein
MNSLKTISFAALMVLFAQASAQAADAKHGHELFLKKGCYQCHGTVGQGGLAGPHLVPGLFPFAAFSAYVRNPANQMPPFSEKVLSNAELGDIHAYLGSLPKSPAADSIKLLPKTGGK